MLLRRYGYELGIVADMVFCKEMGWTVREFEEQPVLHIAIMREYLNAKRRGRKERLDRDRKRR